MFLPELSRQLNAKFTRSTSTTANRRCQGIVIGVVQGEANKALREAVTEAALDMTGEASFLFFFLYFVFR